MSVANIRGMALGVFLAVSWPGQAQKNEYSVHGTVRNAVSQEPVKNALVVLEGFPSDAAEAAVTSSLSESASNPSLARAEQPLSRAVLTGPAGEFHFEGLSNGKYACLARKPGYAQGMDPGNPRTFYLPASPENDGIEINLAPLGAIEGKVVDQYDEPMENVVLDVYQSAIVDGERRASSVGTVWTDDLGSFHLAYLDPGKYYVKAQARRGGTETHFGIHAMRYAPWEAFSSVYYGGGTDMSLATPITVSAGARVRADFQLDMQRSFRIRGKVDGYVAPGSVSFQLVQNDERTEPSRALLNVSTGEFEILDVTPGNYKLHAVQEQTRGEVLVEVGDKDVSGVRIALLPPLTINGSMHSAAGVEQGRAGQTSCQVLLLQQQSGPASGSVPGDTGKFTIPGLFPGEYQASLQCWGGYVEAASFAGTDLLENPVIRISSGATPSAMEIRYRRGGATLNVKFAAQIAQRGAILVVPGFSRSTGPLFRRCHGPERRGDRVEGDVISNLTPGDYVIYALSQWEDAEFRNPAFLQALSAGTKVHLEDGKTAEVTITGFSQ
jgi:hypothetical protein